MTTMLEKMSDSSLANRLGNLTEDADKMIQDAYARQHPEKVWVAQTPADQEAFWHSHVTYNKGWG